MSDKLRGLRTLRAAGILAASAIALSACGAKAEVDAVVETEKPEPVETAAALGSAIAIVNDQTYTFTLTTCRMEPGDIWVAGPGNGGPDSEPAWFDAEMVDVGDTWNGGMRVLLGTDQDDEDTGRAYFISMLQQDDAVMDTLYEDWKIDAVSSGVQVQIERTGRDLAEYTVSGDTVDIRDVEIGSTLKVVTPAATMPVDPTPDHNVGALVKCEPNSMSITLDEGVMQLTR